MAQIKISIAFVLAAAAIATVVAQPIRDGHEFDDHEFAGRIGLRHHDHLHLHHYHRHSIPEQSSLETTSDITPSPSRREYADEFEVRDSFGQDGVLNSDISRGPGILRRPRNGPSTRRRVSRFNVQNSNRPFLLHHGPRVWRGVVAREYAGSDDMIERDLENVESGAKTLPHFRGLFPLRRGPVVHHLPRRPYFGHGPAIHFPPFTPHRPNFGPGPVVRHEPAKPEVVAREYAGVEDMFKRYFEDAELDARDFDDELYLD